MYTDITYEVSEGIAVITIDRPDAANSFTEETILELNDAIRRAGDDDGVYVVVLTGAGSVFCAGADVTEMDDWDEMSKEEYAGFLWSVQNVVRQLRSANVPSIAAVNGQAVGAGCDFALACDLRVIDPDAALVEGFVRVGLVPGDGGGWLLPRLIGEAKAKEYLLTGKPITAEAASDLGLVAEVSDDPLGAALDLAETVRNLPATAVQFTNELSGFDGTFEDYCERAIEYQWECVGDDEHDEAVAAMNEGRDPEFARTYTDTRE